MSLPEAPRKKGSPRPKASIWRTVKAVAWGFFGVRKDSAYQEDIATLTPLTIIIVGAHRGDAVRWRSDPPREPRGRA